VRSGEAQIEVLVDGTGPAVVFLPSSQRDSLDAHDLAVRIAAAGFTVLRPQPRGMGRSRGPLEGITLLELAGDVAAVIERLGHGRAVVVGHAFGHYIARVAALHHTARVQGVVALAAAARVFPAGLSADLDVAADLAQPRAERLAALQRAFFAPGHDPSAWLDGWHPQLRAAYRGAGAVPPKSTWWPVSPVPVLDLQAAQDPWRPSATRHELREAAGDRVTVQVIENASHALYPEQPAAAADAIVGWVRSLAP
jgi:pimeloyl-ACP methyl ester carboxylesterase